MRPTSPAGNSDVRRHNTAMVLAEVLRRPGLSRAGVAAATGLAKATVSSLVDRLVAARLVDESGPQSATGRGRRGTGLVPSPTGPHGLGVEIGVDYVATCLVDPTGGEHAHRVRPGDNRGRPPAEVLAAVNRAVRSAKADAGRRGVAVGGLGVAVPGLVDRVSGVVRAAPNLGWSDVDIPAALGAELPVLVDNEANLAAVGELATGELAGTRDFVLVSAEIGVGAGVVLDGAVRRGTHGFTGEIGHVCVDPDGPVCSCGARGCLERMAGPAAILADAGVTAASAPLDRPLADLAGRLAAADPAALAAVRRAGVRLGIALAGVVNLLDVPAVVLGGGYARLHDWLAGPLGEELDRRVIAAQWSPTTVLVSALGGKAAVYGAGQAALREILADPDTYIRRVADPAS
ncbi:ROK family transcriptional regulator [Actinokineospora sp. UTMC 2448]|uniref:ROK family transcriptional regulator n=1 Tax=Actinokineospora sp. UTMC 2448 TaxID=2268449 RepID=UPI0021645025|nr:ROK family transcriptional regulator [Actinokineospora sp. UTMC 2448]UVS80006.1 N-acetylglucosamine repressor [Actinokineospora sp. UTMC 2448]